MFENLSASRGPRERSVSSTLLSLGCHAAVLVAAAVATRTAAVATPARPPLPDAPYVHLPIARPVAAPRAATQRPSSAPAAIASVAVPVVVPVGLPPISLDVPDGAALRRLLGMPDHDPFTPRGAPLHPMPRDSVHPAMAVDEPVRRLGGPTPQYPGALRASGIEGVVHVRMVVDTLGRVEAGSIVAAGATHPAFEAAAIEALMQSRFVPARLQGRPVRQLVQQTVRFTLE